MKTYLPTRDLLLDVQLLLGTHKPRVGRPSPLGTVLTLLQQGRHYAQARIQVGEPLPLEGDSHVFPIRLASRTLGYLQVEGEHGRLSAADRALLEGVTLAIARYLTGPGKYVLTRARLAASLEV